MHKLIRLKHPASQLDPTLPQLSSWQLKDGSRWYWRTVPLPSLAFPDSKLLNQENMLETELGSHCAACCISSPPWSLNGTHGVLLAGLASTGKSTHSYLTKSTKIWLYASLQSHKDAASSTCGLESGWGPVFLPFEICLHPVLMHKHFLMMFL